MIDGLRGPRALRRRRPFCAWLPCAALLCAAPPATGASGTARAPMAACRAPLPPLAVPAAETADGLPAEHPAGTRHTPAAGAPAPAPCPAAVGHTGASALLSLVCRVAP